MNLTQVAYMAINNGAGDLADIRKAVRKRVRRASDKQIANALAKLVQHRKVKHTGYGQYGV